MVCALSLDLVRGGAYKSSGPSTGEGGCLIPSTLCCGGELSSGRNTSAVGISGESLLSVQGNVDLLGAGRNRPDGPSGVDGTGGIGVMLVEPVVDSGLSRYLVLCSTLDLF